MQETLIFLKMNERIGNLDYDVHALARMEERKLFPSVVESVVRDGIRYPMKHITDFGEVQGGTHLYVGLNIADVLEGGKVGEKMIKVDPFTPRRSKHVLVITDADNVVKTTYLVKDKKLEWFFKTYL